jgi:hypothetical protein
MATLAQHYFDRGTGSPEEPRSPVADPRAAFRLRKFPNEDVHFFVKRIDNSRVVRDSDPRARRKCWNMIVSACAVAVFLTGLFLPSVHGLLAGYNLEALRQEKQRLEKERTVLEFTETKLLTIEHLHQLAERQHFVDSSMPQRFIYLDGGPEGTMAKVNETTSAVDAKR